MADAATGPCPCPNPPATWADFVAHHQGNQMAVSNLSVQQAVENSGRLSAMFGVRAAQSNPIEATAINTLKASEAGGNASSGAIAGQLATILAMLANLAHVSPATQAPPVQKVG